MNDIIEVLRLRHGLDVSGFNASFLANSLDRRRNAEAGENSSDYVDRLSEDSSEAEAFYRSLLVTHSEFFRNPLAFALLEQIIIPGLLEQKSLHKQSELRIWSAGCASGQEACSVAILLDELSVARNSSISYRIFATDLSEPNLAQAQAGVYSADTVGNIRSRQLREYFIRHDESFSIIPRIMERMNFSVYNLLDTSTTTPPESIYGGFDLVMCSNVLFYYQQEAQRFILDKLRRSLAPGGYLLTGETERQIVDCIGGFRAVVPPITIFQRCARKR